MAYCILWQRVLEPTGDEYPDLIAYEFLSLHGFRCLEGNTCSFSSHSKLVELERKYSQPKIGKISFSFISGTGWEFLTDEFSGQEFPLRAYWFPFPDEDDSKVLLSPREEARV